MKIQCDVCNKKEATIFCTADEASLCDVCDHKVHHANKLASKHQRLSLLQPSSSHPPMCDICQEKRAVVFCQEDRAILCRECDISLHTANEYTQNHNRFLLTGIKISSTKIINNDDNTIISKINDDIITINDDGCDTTVPDYKLMNKTTSISNEIPSSIVNCNGDDKQREHYSSGLKEYHHCESDELNNGGGSSSGNISDYLMETLPGWHFDDFILDPSSSTTSASFGIFKSDKNCGYEVKEDMLSFFDVEEREKDFTMYSTQSNNLWVPQGVTSNFDLGSIFDTPKNGTKKHDNLSVKPTKFNTQFRRDDVFTVPQITPSLLLASNKRPRPLY